MLLFTKDKLKNCMSMVRRNVLIYNEETKNVKPELEQQSMYILEVHICVPMESSLEAFKICI